MICGSCGRKIGDGPADKIDHARDHHPDLLREAIDENRAAVAFARGLSVDRDAALDMYEMLSASERQGVAVSLALLLAMMVERTTATWEQLLAIAEGRPPE